MISLRITKEDYYCIGIAYVCVVNFDGYINSLVIEFI